MRLVTAEAQVLSIRDLQEADRVVSLLTSEYGKVRGVARGSKRKFSRFAAPLHPLAKVQASWMEKENSDLVRFSELDLLRPAEGLHKQLEDILYSAYVADQVETFAQERDRSPELYRLLDRVVSSLLAGSDRDTVIRYFEVWTLRLAGIMVEPSACASCGKQLVHQATLQGDGFVCQQCVTTSSSVGREVMGFIALSREQPPEKLASLDWPQKVLSEVETICATIRRRFLDKELRSYRVIQEILHETP